MSGGHVIALSGGIGGAKLALGLDRVLAPGQLTVIANTGDDFRHLGLHISPDIDTLLYTLAGLDDPAKGWGRRDESWTFMRALAELGGETWFQLGDGDLATHVERTRRLGEGESLSQVTDALRRRLGIGSAIVPMSDDPVATRVNTDEGWLDFQHYFVRRRCEPRVSGLDFVGAGEARLAPEAAAAFRAPGLRAVVLCPSNPYLSVDPILAVPGLRAALERCAAPVIAVSPIIAGQAVKGPTAKMMTELGLEPGAATVARHYGGLIDAFVIDAADAGLAIAGLTVAATPTLMRSLDDRMRLARFVLALADRLAGARA
ncbi:2-phospho-L-lactate transferase [Ancylobacter dichloromethanicus]|uniref:LPPG--FO 2-phospho-L-lactate transferase n=1 Tax=Ancylobacter dichloromethanicus TaxID=518825 RepID=A0A9W6N0L3_9HYPH|nr:2-phospho-L-lactate transferase [Ancylobacter dichloromethanicus]MBS7552180.1 2-phospho-L-lactate transferase [Ancylobacter dichloromethanicus]GLK73914.1 LPPG--FO 2-phospho-L-lactate transferase [Ancylobacter dichloromethanicus]